MCFVNRRRSSEFSTLQDSSDDIDPEQYGNNTGRSIGRERFRLQIPGSPLSPAVKINTCLKKYSIQAGGDDSVGEDWENKSGVMEMFSDSLKAGKTLTGVKYF